MPDASMQEQSQRENLRQILNDAHVDGTSPVREATKKALEREVARAVGSCGGIGRAEEPIADRQAEGVALISKVSQATIALRSRLHSLVESTRRRPRGYKHHGTRIAPNRIIRLMWGDSRVFRRKTEVVAVNTAGILLLDRSISMDRSQRIVIARESTLAGALALDSVRGTAVASAAFPGREIDVEPLTSFGESVRKTAGRYAGVSASGGTPLLPAMMWAIEELLARREPRKFILVATDGEPAQPEACKEVIERCWYGGIEVYGLGILAPGVEALFPISRSIQDINEFPRAMFGLLEDAMTRRPVI
jgi:Mg-chelatase subunit ChlD